MNKTAEQHLALAKSFVAKGEVFYRRAAEEIEAAREEGATWNDVADYFKRSRRWVTDIVAWAKNPANDVPSTPFAEPQGAVAKRHARSVLRDSSPDEIAELLSEPTVLAKVSKAQDIAYRDIEGKSRRAQRAAIGEETSDALDDQQHLHEAEAELFKARRGLIETLRLLDSAVDIPESWREEFLRTLDDVVAKAEIARGLLLGNLHEEIAAVLAGEVS